MKKKVIRKIGYWEIIKFKSNMSYYARCKNCKFYYDVGGYDYATKEHYIYKRYNFCPECGRFMINNEEEVYLEDIIKIDDTL